MFFPRNQVKTKKKKLRLYSAGICRIYSCWLALFRLIIQRSNLDGGTLNLDGGTLTLDGGTRPPYNLSTVSNHAQSTKNQKYLFSILHRAITAKEPCPPNGWLVLPNYWPLKSLNIVDILLRVIYAITKTV